MKKKWLFLMEVGSFDEMDEGDSLNSFDKLGNK